MDIYSNPSDVDHIDLTDIDTDLTDVDTLLRDLANRLEVLVYSYNSSLSFAARLKSYLGMPSDSQVESLWLPSMRLFRLPKSFPKFSVEFVGRRIESVPLYSPVYSRYFRYSLGIIPDDIEDDDALVEEPELGDQHGSYGMRLKFPEDTLNTIDHIQIFGFQGKQPYNFVREYDELTTVEVWRTRIVCGCGGRRSSTELKDITSDDITSDYELEKPVLSDFRLHDLKLAYLESKWHPEKGASISLNGMEFLESPKEINRLIEILGMLNPNFYRRELRGRPTGHDLTRDDTILMSGDAIRKLSSIGDKKPTQAQVAGELRVGVSTYSDYLRDYNINWRILLTKSLSSRENELI
ncbi:MAG: hypothetical protein ACLGJB_08985 [Blastocatellia bacterium]